MSDFFGPTATSSPNNAGFTRIPTSGFFLEVLNASKQDPNSGNLLVITDHVIATNAGTANDFSIIEGGTDEPLEVIFVDTLPAILDRGKAYISTKSGFQSAIYLSPSYINQQFKYSLGAYASTASAVFMRSALPVGHIYGKVFNIETKYEKLCDGQLLQIHDYPVYADACLRTGLLFGGDGITTVGVPSAEDVMPSFYVPGKSTGERSVEAGQIKRKINYPRLAAPHDQHKHQIRIKIYERSGGDTGKPGNGDNKITGTLVQDTELSTSLANVNANISLWRKGGGLDNADIELGKDLRPWQIGLFPFIIVR